MRTLPLAALTAALLVSSAQAQGAQAYPDTQETRTSTLFVFGEAGPQAAMSITHGQPQWKPEYENALDGYKGQKVRLGSGWWTTMSIAQTMTIGDTKLRPGTYVLGLEYTTDGKFHLLAIDSKMAMEKKWMPWDGKGWTDEIKVPLKFNKGGLEKTVEKMEISITPVKDEPAHADFSIRWGTHELAASAKFHVGGAHEANADKEKKAKEAAMEKKDMDGKGH